MDTQSASDSDSSMPPPSIEFNVGPAAVEIVELDADDTVFVYTQDSPKGTHSGGSWFSFRLPEAATVISTGGWICQRFPSGSLAPPFHPLRDIFLEAPKRSSGLLKVFPFVSERFLTGVHPRVSFAFQRFPGGF